MRIWGRIRSILAGIAKYRLPRPLVDTGFRPRDAVLIALLIALLAERVLNHGTPWSISPNTLTAVRDLLLSVLQVVGLLLLLSTIVATTGWLLFHKGSQTVVCAFECRSDEKFAGRTMADLLVRELHSVYEIHKEQERLEAASANEAPAARETPASSPRRRPNVSDTGARYDQTQFEDQRYGFNTLKVRSVPESLPESFADSMALSIGGTTISVGRLLAYISRSLEVRRADYVIRGRVQRFGSVVRLVTELEDRRSDHTEEWEVSREIKAESEIRDMVRDLACQMYRRISPGIKAKTWPAFSHYTRALDAYHTYLLTGRLEDLDRAHTSCLAARDAEPRYESLTGLCFEIAFAHYALEQYSQAAALLKAGLEVSDGNLESSDAKAQAANMYNTLGVALVMEKDRIGGERCFRRAIELSPGLVGAYNNLILVLAESGWMDGSRDVLRVAETRGLLDSLPSLERGAWYVNAGLLEDALTHYRDPENRGDAEAAYRIAGILALTERPEEAVQAYQRAIALEPRPSPLYDLALLHAATGDSEQAIAAYRSAISLAPEFVEAYVNLASHLADEGKLDDAVMCFQRARNLDPQNAYAAYGFSGVLLKSEQYADAVAMLKVAIDLQPENPWFHNQLGYAYRLLRRPEDALAEYKRSVESDPSIARLYMDVGDQLAALGRLTEAIAQYELALGLEPDDALAHASASSLYRQAGRDLEAGRHRAIALELGAESVPGDYDQACFEALCGNADRALAKLESALRKNEQSPAYARSDQDLQSLHSDIRFNELLARLASPEAAVT